MHAIKAGLAYAALVFVAGFGLGLARVLLLVPRLGETISVSLEVPIILVVSWMVSQWCTERLRVRLDAGSRLLMGAVALGSLLIAEAGVSILLFGTDFVEYLARFGTLSGAIGLAAQICFAGFPAFQAKIYRRFC